MHGKVASESQIETLISLGVEEKKAREMNIKEASVTIARLIFLKKGGEVKKLRRVDSRPYRLMFANGHFRAMKHAQGGSARYMSRG